MKHFVLAAFAVFTATVASAQTESLIGTAYIWECTEVNDVGDCIAGKEWEVGDEGTVFWTVTDGNGDY
jgi:hypothetical protein